MKCPCGFDPSIQRITVGGMSVGIAGLEEIFRDWLAAGDKGSALTKDQVIREIRKHNYILPRLQDEYAAAVRVLYTSYCEK